MATQARVIWDERFTGYNFGDGHPMSPVRLDLTVRLCRELGLLDLPGVEVVVPDLASDELLETVHDPAYVAAVRAASEHPERADVERGLGTEDDPAFVGMHEVTARIAGGTVDVARAVWEGSAEHGVNFCGGLHHAMADHASGFCIYNDVAVGIQWLLDHGAEKVAYVDVDVHHGDGVERIFWNDPRVLTISLHESGRLLFPGTGFPGDCGGPDARGSAANVALPPGTGDAAWLRAFHAVVPALLRAFRPDVLVTQQGCDSHYSDPLAHLALSIDAQRTSYDSLHALAHEVCEGRWVALGGGGYEVVDVVPRAWAHLTAIAAHQPIPLESDVPAGWREHVLQLYGRHAPLRMGDGVAEGGRMWWRSWEVGYNPEDAVDHAVMATREAVFPSHGLDMFFD
ncbi:MAG TPA: acetoin utilization protein AcuC [Segeticoccus sp.]|uniref:acetoin utilization protein AcuC n=1 Tax=Segeticoccus sp. TaxID=2706531 RepID=UPI002D802672|nr:acetoin utilization protein AcuC [Segeticoccus sp.]HET8599171.1 acetoin utilization protein AcuC [Segeticoccus sp.]